MEKNEKESQRNSLIVLMKETTGIRSGTEENGQNKTSYIKLTANRDNLKLNCNKEQI